MDWQKKLRYRGFRLLGFSLPLLMLSLMAASFIPRRPPQTLATGELPRQKKSSGRLVVPVATDGEIPVTLALQWAERPPSGMRMEILISDPTGQDQIQKKIKIKAKPANEGWHQTLMIPMPSEAVLTYTLAAVSRNPTVTRYSFIAFASSPALRILRIGEMLFYPALAFAVLALVMILFPLFAQS